MADSLAPIILKGAADLIATMFKAYFSRSEKSSSSAQKLPLNITPHIEATFNKCKVIKTLLNPHRPAEFLSIYATQRLTLSNGVTHDHYAMVDYIRSTAKNLIITGSGGTGKSMFTRYLWLSMFVHSEGRIPLFIELRNINNITISGINSFILSSINLGNASLDEDDFRKYLSNGDFVIILDGYDEVSSDKKDGVKRDIIYLTEHYPDLKIIVTSRPDGDFTSWPSFEVATVAPLQKNDLIQLIELAEFEEESKGKFIERIKRTEIFHEHYSFLSNPLLASMMLLTFSHNFTIPERMHLFYEQAFDALYQRHDSYKPGGYKREFKTGISEDVLKRVLSYFCFQTYLREKLTFTREEVTQALTAAINAASARVDAAKLLSDLEVCVCFLILDGPEYTFSHRSFQEYFCSYCMPFVDASKFRELVIRFSHRVNDQVVRLLSDMNPELFRRLYVLPMAEKYAKELQIDSSQKSIAVFFEDTETKFELQLAHQSEIEKNKRKSTAIRDCMISYNTSGEFSYFVETINRLHVKNETIKAANERIKLHGYTRKKDNTAASGIFRYLNVNESAAVNISGLNGKMLYVVREANNRNKNEIKKEEVYEDDKIDVIFMKSYMYEFMKDRLLTANEYVLQQRKDEKQYTDAIDEFINIGQMTRKF
jgi:hypothetical protein